MVIETLLTDKLKDHAGETGETTNYSQRFKFPDEIRLHVKEL